MLFGQVNGAHAAFAERLQEFVGADPRAGTFVRAGWRSEGDPGGGGDFEVAAEVLLLGEESVNALVQDGITRAGLVEEGGTRGGGMDLSGGDKDFAFSHGDLA
jgi:hypothetical protein